ncbi:MAG: hypothetical protein EAZ37_12555 [Burkholderiales bacterium]|nr:MAG: hypothetical protein EAZ37_12555 [Burkholderiales bacterium]
MTKTPIKELAETIKLFEAVKWVSSGEPEPLPHGEYMIPWVKFELAKSELGWRTLEFLAWAVSDVSRAGEDLLLMPTSPPPYLNTPGAVLAFVIEYRVDSLSDSERMRKTAAFLRDWHEKYWPASIPRRRRSSLPLNI